MAIPSGGLIHKYDLLDPACYVGGIINDLVGTLDLNVDGSPTYDATIGSLTWNGTGVGAYSAAGSYANITTTFTVSFWFKGNDFSATQLLFNNGERTSSWSGYSSFLGTDTKIDFGANYVWGGTFGCPILDPNTYYNATYTFNATFTQLKFYLNGVLISNNPSAGGAANAYGANAFLAWGGSGTAGRGAPALPNKTSYGVVLFYNTVLNDTQVADIYNTYVDRFVPPVHAYDAADPASYPGSGSTLTDIGYATPINLSLANATFNNVNDSFALDGTLGSYIRSANSLAGFDIGANNFSIQYWFKYDGVTAQPPYNIFLQIGSRTGSPSAYSGFTNFTYNGEFNIGKPGVADYPTGFNPVIGTWYQVTMTVNSSNLVTLYINGTSVYTQTIAFVTPDNIIAIGDNGIQTDQVANASVGPLKIYDRVLSTTEITNYYNTTRSRFRVIVQYDFQNGSYSGTGNTVYDLLSPQTNLTVDNGHWVAGTPNYWDLQGDTNLVNSSPGSSFSSTTFTINCWYYPDFSTIDQYAVAWCLGIFGFNPAAPTRAILSTNNAINECNQGWDYGYGNVSSAVTLEWHLFTIVSNGSTVTTYVDGILIGSTASTNGLIGSPYTIRLGSGSSNGNTPQEYSKGKIGFWNYYDIALNSTEVLYLYNATQGSYDVPIPYQGLVGGRTFGQGFAG